ncbi:mechanosensitive ion channel family protein [Hippea maritima]|uniref:MscS Mechanosensitive ion channel n=1 Tax=Hippea maritima (strain ATCC 700847 / DSM 10411 / MH2) TaxID=760142 RepID=F2LY20_HIPMA|nr:mechanosensitive ion channel family protein [Hippea maritima]AEA33285.1 MscS Mechanosensitive ion channel [Hippea maritima DSM 10411]
MNGWEKFNDLLNKTFMSIQLKNLLAALFVLFILLLFKKIAAKILFSSLKRIAKRTKTNIDDEIITIIESPTLSLLTVFCFYIAFLILNLGVYYNLIATKILISFVILFISWAVYRAENILSKSMESFFRKKNYEIGLSFVPFFNRFIKVSVIVVAFILIVQEWGYNIGAIITGLGIGGLAVALAAKDTLANMFGGLTIILDRPFKIGDWVKVGDVEGIIEDIGFRSTRIRTFEKSLISLPNSVIANTAIENFSRRNIRRISYKIGITYSTPKEKVKEAVNQIREMLENHPYISKEATLMVYFTEFADSSLNIFIYCFTTTAIWGDYLSIREDVNLKIMEIMEDLGIEFAFPSMSVYIEKNVNSE